MLERLSRPNKSEREEQPMNQAHADQVHTHNTHADGCCPPTHPHGAQGYRSIEEHYAQTIALAEQCKITDTALASAPEAAGLYLAEAVHARLPIPPWSNSAMDGFLVRREDVLGSEQSPVALPITLPVAGDVPAGHAARAVPPGHAVRIMTGAPIREQDLDHVLVIPVEFTNIPADPHPLPTEVTIHQVGGAAIRPRSANIQVGDLIAQAGSRVDAGLIAAFISAGTIDISVRRPASIAIVSSGDELLDPAAIRGGLAEGMIPDSNGPMLAALLRQAGYSQVTVAYTSDEPEEFSRTLDELSQRHDMIITTGGVSAGAFDVTRQVGEEKDVWFGPVNMKPGKPQGLGRWNKAMLVCLPGNPVAVWVSFHIFVRPALDALQGLGAQPRRVIPAVAGARFPSSGDRTGAVPVRLEFAESQDLQRGSERGSERGVEQLFPVALPYSESHLGSHFVGSLGNLDGIVIVEADPSPSVQPGDIVSVIVTSG
ncbi:molybdopterin molybdotransferase MoeA [Corynebacterium sp. 320]|nr:molybdopterin molybdotransferase MoeA [Corynebacterium sp. 320]KAB1552875.1 molybdopterin molybdotransferase MoeA [Corynebacterium sp. 321]KAB1553907.1 molybdopterin molybdotransferase MoeA [Corynebacterium sp. 319]KAB3528162.1 molybdopterin molybdotransferase MoeA [Corynebacterium sp. 250]KAB3540350.1 molybdopterin molybdotransferase MoeA [Corynebacterium sp. 366]